VATEKGIALSSLTPADYGDKVLPHFMVTKVPHGLLGLIIAAILSAAMMLRWSFSLTKEADAIESAVAKVLSEGYRTTDIAYSDSDVILGTKEMTAKVIESII
jgi:hypothetical protein